MSIQLAAIAGDGDHRLSVTQQEKEGHVVHQPANGRDWSISFEEFVYWASITREDERAADKTFRDARGPRTVKSIIRGRFSSGKNVHDLAITSSGGEQHASAGGEIITGVSEQEWKTASRAMRTASWGAVFYLITTDVLGPYTTPWAFAQMGYGPGVALYTVFGAMAG